MFLAVAVLVAASPALAGPALPSQTCSVAQACQPHQDNVIESVAGVETVSECKQLCNDVSYCNMISHFGPDGFPFSNYCMLLRSCPNLHDCRDCWSEDKSCFSSCDVHFDSQVEDNVLDVLLDVADEPSCLQSCQLNSSCTHFTFYTGSNPDNPNLCLLLSGLQGALQPCDHCRTGITLCGSPYCSLAVGSNKTHVSHGKITEIGLTDVAVIAVGECEMSAVVVGAGGLASYDGGAGGSGYVEAVTLAVISPSHLLARLGNTTEQSALETLPGETILKAASGENGGTRGGSGYSGGGGRGNSNGDGGNGGQDGGDGQDGSAGGGTGSGFNLASIRLQSFSITPGVGGLHDKGPGGGGGGGVLLDGEGPQYDNYTGQGYGGGAGFSNKPGQALVLIEIKPSRK